MKWPRAFSFWALTLGAMVNDLEVAPMWVLSGDIYHSRGVMHSVLGVLTLNAAITVVATMYVVPAAMRWLDRRWGDHRIFRFAGQDLHADPKDLSTVYSSAAFGGLTHILVDVPTHAYNPVWWPWQIGPLNLLPFADQLWWDAVAGVAALLLFAWMMYAFWRH